MAPTEMIEVSPGEYEAAPQFQLKVTDEYSMVWLKIYVRGQEFPIPIGRLPKNTDVVVVGLMEKVK